MKKIKKMNNSSLINSAATSHDKRILVLKDLPDNSRECKLCRGVNGDVCDVCGDTFNSENNI